MKLFKLIDCAISVFLLAWTINYCFGADNETDLLVLLFFIGAWHIISMVVHFFTQRPLPAVRSFYHWLTFPALLIMLLIADPVLPIAGPVMATFYTALCLVETFNLIRHENK